MLQVTLGRCAARIAMVSQFSAGELARYAVCPADKIIVIPNGHEHAKRWTPSHSAMTRAVTCSNMIGIVGSTASHKNIKLILDLAGRLDRAGLRIAVVGLGDPRVFAPNAAAPRAQNVHWLGRLSDSELAALFGDCLCLALPSFVEGFGLPPFEAMAPDYPVVTSDRGSLPEVCGEAVLYASLKDPEAWLAQLVRMSQDRGLHARMIRQGRATASVLPWGGSAELYLRAMGRCGRARRGQGADRSTNMHHGSFLRALGVGAIGLSFRRQLPCLSRGKAISAGFSQRNLLIFLFGLFMFVAGFAIQKYKYFPYPQISRLVKQAASTLRATYVTPDKYLSDQYSLDSHAFSLDRDLDTALLPLKVRGIRLSESYPMPKAGGAITTVGNAVIVLDRLGKLYAYQLDTGVERLPFPALPNNIGNYVLQTDYKIDERNFRAHAIKYSQRLQIIAVSHEYFDKRESRTRLAVSVINVSEAPLRPIGSWKTIYLSDAEPAEPNESGGGALAFGDSDKIYLTVGDYLWPALAQDPRSSFGKIVEISIGTQKARKLTLGHRNPQGLTIIKTGALMSIEQGPAGGDELNEIVEGSNYGWPNVTLGTDYGTYDSRNNALAGRHDGYKAPIFAWLPSVAVSNLIQVEGFHPRWDDDLLVASLKAGSLFRLRLNGPQVLYSETIYIGQRIRDIAQLEKGALVLWTDDTQLLLVTVDRQKLNERKRSPTIHDTLRYDCMYCHHFGPTNPTDFAPSLSHVFNRRIASDNFRYTAALRNKDGAWTEKNLREFLADPSKFASGTSMPRRDLSADAIDEVIRDLESAGPGAN